MPTKLTQRIVDQLAVGKPHPEKDPKDPKKKRAVEVGTVVRATEPKGLLVKVGKTAKTYCVQRELWVGERGTRRLVKTVRYTIGRTDDMSLEEATTRALDVLAQIRRGIDPNARATDAGAWTVRRAYDRYAADLIKSGGSERTVALIRERLDRYLADWLSLPLSDVTPHMCADRHDRIMRDIVANAKQPKKDGTERSQRITGARAANQTMRDFRAVWNRIAKLDPSLPNNPTYGVTEAKEGKGHYQIQPEDLAEWCRKLGTIPSQLRRRMHLLGLFSGLRPGNLVAIERAWINLDKQVIAFPADVMKGRRPFDLPLSAHMVALIREALVIGDAIHPGSPYLFPSKDHDGKVIATAVWREKKLPNATGHALRHTYSNLAGLARVDDTSRMMLLAHAIPGIQGRYLDQPTLWPRLLEDQEKVTAHILSLINK